MAPEIKCPKCESTQITANKKGFSATKAIGGAILTGGIGLVAGTIGSGKIKITCLACGHQFKPGEDFTTVKRQRKKQENMGCLVVVAILLMIVIISCSTILGYTQVISAGGAHSLMLCADSSAWSVGGNVAGQLGDSTTITKITPVQVNGLTNIISIKAGASHSIALKEDGTVWSWGNNNDGQLGNSTTISSIAPIQVPGLSNIVKIIAGEYHNIAIASDSTRWMWGDNGFKQINGSGSDHLWPINVGGLSNVIDVSAGSNHTVVLYNDSTIGIWTTGNSGWGFDLADILQIGSGDNNFFAITSDTIWGWGENSYGQLGDSTTIDHPIPVPVLMPSITGLNNIMSITGGVRHSLALRNDGTVWAWGWNGLGQLGDGTIINRLTPVQVLGLDSIVSISSGRYHSMALRADLTVWGWGQNGVGQLGNNTIIDTNTPIQMMLSCISCPVPQIFTDIDTAICDGDSIMIYNIYRKTAGNYYDSLITTSGCDSIVLSTLTINSLPTVSFSGLDAQYCTTDTIVTLTGTPTGGTFSGAGMGSDQFNPSDTGNHTITYAYTDGNGCTDSVSQSTYVSICTGIEDYEFTNNLEIYPNPNSGEFIIKNLIEIEIIKIFNNLGQQVIEIKEPAKELIINMKEFPPGIYNIQLISRGKSRSKKIILSADYNPSP